MIKPMCLLMLGEQLRIKNIGKEWKYPAYSCREIAEKTSFTSGYYWMELNEGTYPRPRFCELDTEFDIGERGWLRVANWNMTEQFQCPRVEYRNIGFKLIDSPERLCARETLSRGCSTVRFDVGTYYNKVCGRNRTKVQYSKWFQERCMWKTV